MSHKISVKVLDVESAEYLHPANHTIQLRFADQSWLVIDKWKDWDLFKPVVDYAEDPKNDFRVIPFGEKARLEEESFKALMRAEAEKVFAEKEAEKAKQKAAEEQFVNIAVPALLFPPKPEPQLELPIEAPQVPAPIIPEHHIDILPKAPPVPEPEAVIPEAPPIVETPVVAVVNVESSEKPTVVVTMPEVIAPIMQAEVTNVVPEVSTTSIDPQVEIKLTPVEAVASDAVVAQAETLPAESANIAVAVTPEDDKKLKDAGVSVVDVVEKAIDESPTVELPPKAAEIAEVPVITPELPAAIDKAKE